MRNDSIQRARVSMNFSLSGTKLFFPKASVLLGLFFFAVIGEIRAYDSPDFTYNPFSSDGLFLEEQEQAILMQALLAVAANSSTEKQIDSDLKEKAIAIGLQIAPLNDELRKAHQLLLGGKVPVPTPEKFQKQNAIAISLWQSAENLLGEKPEPEAVKLASYLMDISITLYRTPPPKQLQYFARLRDFELLPWKDFISLQPDTNPSSSKVGMLFSLLKMSGPSASTLSAPEELAPKRKPEVKPVDVTPGSALKLKSAFLPAIGFSDEPTVAGILHLIIKPLEPAKQEGLSATKPVVHLAGAVGKDGNRLTGFKEMATLIRARHRGWPSKVVGVFSLVPVANGQDLSTEDRQNISLPGMILANSVYTGKKINQSIVFGGQFLSNADSDPTLVPPGSSSALFEKAKLIKAPFLAIPESSHKSLLARVIALGSLDHLAEPQLLSFVDLDDAIKLATDEPEELLTKAGAAFQEIVAISSRMSLDELAKNKSIQSRLEKIVTTYPRHLSARIMLEFGKTNL